MADAACLGRSSPRDPPPRIAYAAGMGTRAKPGRSLQSALAPCLIALAIFLRLAVPAGWMPATDGLGITPCAGLGAIPVVAAKSGHGMHHGGEAPESKQDHSCPFAGFGASLAEPREEGNAVATPLAVGGPPVLLPTISVYVGRGLAAPLPPPTGPPALA